MIDNSIKQEVEAFLKKKPHNSELEEFNIVYNASLSPSARLLLLCLLALNDKIDISAVQIDSRDSVPRGTFEINFGTYIVLGKVDADISRDGSTAYITIPFIKLLNKNLGNSEDPTSLMFKKKVLEKIKIYMA